MFTFSFPVTLTLTFRPQIAPLVKVILVQRYVFTKLEVSTDFPISRKLQALVVDGQTNTQTDRQTDGRGATLNAASYREGCIIAVTQTSLLQ